MKYSVDTSAILEGRIRSYPPDVFPAVWEKLEELVEQKMLIATEEVLVELEKKDDEVFEWARQHKDMFIPLDTDIQVAVKSILKSHERLAAEHRTRSRADVFVIALAQV